MEYVIGGSLALIVGLFAALVGLDRDRAFYPTVLIVVAAYYDLFACMNGLAQIVVAEAIATAAFVCISVIGLKTNLWLVAAGLAGHGVFDLLHGHVIDNPGVPTWWPLFCASYDVVAGAYLAWRLTRGGPSGIQARAGTDYRLTPHVDAELVAATDAERVGDAHRAFGHLERAHILAQASTAQHVRVHVHMLLWGLRQRRLGEVMGQAQRVIGAAILTAFGLVPRGNTGGSNVSAFRAMPIPQDLREIIGALRRER